MTAKLTDILRAKKPGDEWYTLQAPEELHFWSVSHPWKDDFYPEYGVYLKKVRVSTGEIKTKGTTNKFSKKVPLHLKCGITIDSGYDSSRTTKSAVFEIDVANVNDFNMVMTELSAEYSCKLWDVREIFILSDDKVCQFKYHNPDGNGKSLFFWALHQGSERKLYPGVMLSTQELYCKGFREKIAHCTAVRIEEIGHGCALKSKIRKKQIVTRKKGQVFAGKTTPGQAVATL